MKSIFVTVVTVLLFLSCASAPESVKEQERFGGFDITPSHELLGLRIVLIRPSKTTTRTRTVTAPGGGTEEQTQVDTSNANDHPLCIDLGNGVSVDSNGVIFLPVLNLFGLDMDEDWDVEGRVQKSFGYTVYRKRGNTVDYDWENAAFLVKVSEKVQIYPDKLERTAGKFVSTVTETKDGFSFKNNIPLFGKERFISAIDENTVDIVNYRAVQEGDTIYFMKAGKTDLLRRMDITGMPSRIVLNNGVLDIYVMTRTLYVFKKEVLTARIFKTAQGYAVYEKSSFGFKKTVVPFDGRKIELKQGMLLTYFKKL
ncbi:MAG: hypothetical protein JXB03_03155 [Spirochaetales bacterium]|nr:hypothetical protein [Spirochaetales bacterium]